MKPNKIEQHPTLFTSSNGDLIFCKVPSYAKRILCKFCIYFENSEIKSNFLYASNKRNSNRYTYHAEIKALLQEGFF